MEPIAEVAAAVVRLVRGRVGREEGCRSAHTALAVVGEARRRLDTCGEGERSEAFEGGGLSGAFVDAVPPPCRFSLSLDLPFPCRVFLSLQPEGC